MHSLPLPPSALREYVGRTPPGEDSETFYLEAGRRSRARIEQLLPDRWTWPGRRVLDFGCGAGRVLRHFVDVAGEAEVWGCDIDAASIEWLDEHLVPPLHVARIAEDGRLPHTDGSFDAIWALSVFTHLAGNWADWLLELRRVLRDDGVLIATFLNEGMRPLWDEVTGGAPWNPDRFGMAVFGEDAPWDSGGPTVFLSEWWLRAHWGRAFEIDQLATSGFGPGGQGYVVLRKRAGDLSTEDLRRAEPGEERERLARELPRGPLGTRLRRRFSSRFARPG
jgi:SAM-dependent methyltransferase